MVGVDAAQVVDMQRDPGVIDEAAEEFEEQVDVEFADARTGVVNVVFQSRPSRQVDHHARQRLVERHVGVTVATDALLVAERLREGLPERDPGVFHRVMGVDVQIALGLDVQIDQAVARDLVEHVVEKRHAGGKPGYALAIEIETDRDPGFEGIASDLCGAHGVGK